MLQPLTFLSLEAARSPSQARENMTPAYGADTQDVSAAIHP
jgi:hypothetical protein